MKSALLLLDLQNEMVDPAGKVGAHGLARIVEERGVLTNAKRCLDAARVAGMARRERRNHATGVARRNGIMPGARCHAGDMPVTMEI